jgi:hypothetical protein
MNTIQFGAISSRFRSLATLSPNDLPSKMSERLCVALGSRIKPEFSLEIYRKFLTSYSGNDPTMLAFCETRALQLARIRPGYWPKALTLVEQKYALGVISDEYYWLTRVERLDDALPPEVAVQIASHPKKYPRFFVYLAEGRCQLDVETRLPSIADIAKGEGWFAPAVRRRLS